MFSSEFLSSCANETPSALETPKCQPSRAHLATSACLLKFSPLGLGWATECSPGCGSYCCPSCQEINKVVRILSVLLCLTKVQLSCVIIFRGFLEHLPFLFTHTAPKNTCSAHDPTKIRLAVFNNFYLFIPFTP